MCAVLATSLLSAAEARAELKGFQINKIEGLGDLEGKLNDRLTEELKVSYLDCQKYLLGAVPLEDLECEPEGECPEGQVCSMLNGKAHCVECVLHKDCEGEGEGAGGWCSLETNDGFSQVTQQCVQPTPEWACYADKDCTDPTPSCAVVGGIGTCVACTEDRHCPGANDVCAAADGSFTCQQGDPEEPCTPACDEPTPICTFDQGAHDCVECVLDTDCDPGFVCDYANYTCVKGSVPQCDPACNPEETCVWKDGTPQCKPDCKMGGYALVSGEYVCVSCTPTFGCAQNEKIEWTACDMHPGNENPLACVDLCKGTCAGTALPNCARVGGEWTCVECTEDSQCGAVGVRMCNLASHTCMDLPAQPKCSPEDKATTCGGAQYCALLNGEWQCVQCIDDVQCRNTDQTKPVCAFDKDGQPICVECANDWDCEEGTCDLDAHTCDPNAASAVEPPRILLKWSVDSSSYSGWSYAVKIGSCSETIAAGEDILSEGKSDSCRYLVEKTEFSGYSNIELKVDLRQVLGADCAEGETGDKSIYFFAQDDGLTWTEVAVVKITYDYDAPTTPGDLALAAGENNLRASWTDEANSGFVEYNIYWSDKTFGDADLDSEAVDSKTGLTAKEYQIKSLEVGHEYWVGLTAIDDYGNESELSETVSAVPIRVDDFWETYKDEGQEEGGFCFVATAAYGTPMAPSVVLLRDFRDGVLLASPWGRGLVDFYYLYSPPAAAFIRGSPALRLAARVALVPAVALAWVTVAAGPVARAVLLTLPLALVLGLAWSRRQGRYGVAREVRPASGAREAWLPQREHGRVS
jgi:hypothetical protein